ncbi:MAG: folate-binding protein YgfZ [Alphaproteobacteria bacterium]|nr:folate-binding protein YgfZ [Alphaproteobacteria bacterium]
MQHRATTLAGRGLLAITGEDTTTYLQGLISNDIEKVTDERAVFAALLSAQGKFLHDFIVFRIALDGRTSVVLDLERARQADLLRRLTLYRLRAKVEFLDVTDRLRTLALWGPNAAAQADLASEPGAARTIAGGLIAVDPRHVGLGLRAWIPATAAEAVAADLGFVLADEAAYDAHRLALGIPDGSRDVVIDKSLPLECGFDELNAVDYKKGCYVGQEMTARTHYRATIRKRLYQVAIDGPLPAPGTPIMRGEAEAGEMRSGLGQQGLALLKIDEAKAAIEGRETLSAGTSRLRPTKPAWANF